MAKLSAETLFNFTDSLDFLLNNLTSGIYCHNSYEKLPIKDNGYTAPMACFCDIPLSLIKDHFEWYGRYGLGIKRSYARDNGVRPVWYVTSESEVIKHIIANKSLSEYERKYIVPYLKQFIGYQDHPAENKAKRKKFYDEREWRYIADSSDVITFFKAPRSKANTGPSQKRLKLELSAIEYIIIDSDKDIKVLLSKLKNLSKKNSYSYENLVSKIITARNIERDF